MRDYFEFSQNSDVENEMFTLNRSDTDVMDYTQSLVQREHLDTGKADHSVNLLRVCYWLVLMRRATVCKAL